MNHRYPPVKHCVPHTPHISTTLGRSGKANHPRHLLIRRVVVTDRKREISDKHKSNMRSTLSILFCLASVASAEIIDGYLVNESNNIGYKIMYNAKPWKAAREACQQEGGMLAVPNSEEEFRFVQQVVRSMQYKKVANSSGYLLLAWLGVSNEDDYSEWTTVEGENLYNTGFNRWIEGHGELGKSWSSDPNGPHCVGIDARNDGYRNFWCAKYQPFVCQKKM